MEAKKKKLQRNVSAKVFRHEQAIEKYKNYQANKNNDEKLNDMMHGQVHKEYVSRPGEFMVVASGKVEDKNQFLDIPLFSLLDVKKQYVYIQKNKQRVQKHLVNQKLNHKKTSNLSYHNKHKKIRQRRPQTSKLGNYILDSQYQMKSINEEDNFIQFDEANESFDNNNKRNIQSQEIDLIQQNSQTRFTKNIKIILDKQHINFLSPTTKVMKMVVENNVKKEGSPDKKLIEMLNRVNSAKIKPLRPISSIQMFNNGGPRPISAQFIIQNLQGENAERATESKLVQDALLREQKNLDKITKKRSSYQSSVPEYKRTVKHITGYNTVILEQEDYEKKWNYNPSNGKKENNYQQKIQTAIDFTKQSPYLRGNLNAEKLIMKQKGIDYENQVQVQEIMDIKQGNFLPLDYYNLDDDDLNPQQTLEKYREQSGIIWGFSKYFDNHGSFEWQLCQVIKFDNEKDQFLIQWESSKQKYVSRVNLRFKNENEQDFQRKLQAAEYYRDMSEIYLKYNYIIDTMETETSEINKECIERIKVLVAGFTFKLNQLRDPLKYFKLESSIKYNMKRQLVPKQIVNCEKRSEEQLKQHENQKENSIKRQANQNSPVLQKNTSNSELDKNRKQQVPKQTIIQQGKTVEEIFLEKRFKQNVIQQLVEDIKKEFIRANHKVEYNNTLPYHEERQKLFKYMLSDELFEPIIDKQRKESNQLGCLDAGYPNNHKPIHFINSFKKMSQVMHVANKERLEILSNMNASLMNFSQQLLVLNVFKYPIFLNDFKKQFENKYQDVIRELTLKISDTNIDIINMVKEEIRIAQKKIKNQLEQSLLMNKKNITSIKS
ncbi:hypothetical protein IMG5_190740 [Ichthyophthirius multifiliis]|uniref:Uncharacterized protein n=1 Tax=Ichthyophthirius multifiliis TaxID=5932 RepID=G0R4A7_ICHMU|nr:hypothetical protein IMG5_190740 [Ichthyophthirius multifiliis]EGR27718.1 hypothetical protein IMG5_190740 [Ichthyophthirius multifiliis]|eukprot:XP_004025170.1 hypothetical protein IMG5_190740 [Ichthyophthirius multifiliis]